MVLVKSEEDQSLREAVVMGGGGAFLEAADLPVDLAEEREFQGGGYAEVLPRTRFRNEGLTPSAAGRAVGRWPSAVTLWGLPQLKRTASLTQGPISFQRKSLLSD